MNDLCIYRVNKHLVFLMAIFSISCLKIMLVQLIKTLAWPDKTVGWPSQFLE